MSTFIWRTFYTIGVYKSNYKFCRGIWEVITNFISLISFTRSNKKEGLKVRRSFGGRLNFGGRLSGASKVGFKVNV